MTTRPTLTRRHFVAGAAVLMAPFRVSAQGTPTPPSQPALAAAMMLDRLPGKRVNAFFAHHSFASGAEAPAFERVGSALVLVESGALTLTGDGPVAVRRAGEIGPVVAAEIPAEGVRLVTGDAALIAHGQAMGLVNAGAAPATFSMLVAYAPYHQFSYVHPTSLPDAIGVTTTVIGLGTGAFAEVPAIMLIERDLVRPRGTAYSTTFGGIEIGAVASGSAEARLMAGTGWTTPNALNRSVPPIREGEREMEPGATIDLAAGDGYVSHSGSILWRATGKEPLVVARAQLIPVPQPGQ